MKIFINQDSKKFVSSQKFNAVVNRFDFKRGDTAKIELGYVQDNELVQLTGAYTIVFGIKEAGKYDGDYVVYEAVFVYNAVTGFYEGTPNFNTIELNLLLGADDGDDTNDIPYIDCLFEITATDDDGISSSATSTARVFHDVNKGNEGIPTGANPSYSVVGHVHSDYAASIVDLKARDWVEVARDTIDSSSPWVAWAAGKISVMYLLQEGLNLNYPEIRGELVVDRRTMDGASAEAATYRVFTSETGAIYTSNYNSAAWTPWQKVITSEAGVISDDLEFSSATLTAPNLVSTAPESLVTRADLEAQFEEGDSYEITSTSGTVNLDYKNHYIDPTAGDVTLTLPDSQLASSDGALVTIKRVENGGNIVKIETAGGDSINSYSTDVILSNGNEYITLQALPIIGWQTLNKHTTAYASIALSTPTTFAATTGFTKLTTWDLDLFSTNQKFEANSASSTLDVLHHTGAVFDAYSINVTVSIEGLKDKYIEAQLYDGAGNPLSPFVAVNGLGAGKPITITLTAEVLIAAVGTIEVRLISESAQTLTISAASFLGNRIND